VASASVDFARLDWGRLLHDASDVSAFKDIEDRARSRVVKYHPITPAERLAFFERIGYTPHGLYVPTDEDERNRLLDTLRELGEIDDDDKRLWEYKQLQQLTESWERQGVPGRWTGQQGIARSEARYRLAAMGRRSGKALALDTKLPTPRGWTAMGSVEVGDELLDETGRPCRVTYATPIMEGHDCYEVEFSDGQRVVADAEHLWPVEPRTDYFYERLRKSPTLLRTTKQLQLEYSRWSAMSTRPRDYKYSRDFVAIRQVESVPVRCIEVDSPSHLYLCAGFIPTHNTYHAAREALAVLDTRPRSVVTVVAPTMRLVSRCFDMIHELIIDQGYRLTIERDTEQVKVLQLDNGSRVEGQSADNVLSLAGTSVDLAIGDEAAQFVPDTWERGIQPTLLDKRGHALLISSYEGQGDFFETKAVEAEIRQAAGGPVLWAYFRGPSWDNFFTCPQGRNSPAIIEAEQDTTDRQNFLEQYGAIPSGAKERVYPEYRERVHVERISFDPDWPHLYATADPSSGSNEYAIAIIQDFPDGKCRQHPGHIPHFHIIDEFYETHVSAKQIHPILERRPWFRPRIEILVDPASPDQAREWSDLGWNAILFAKPEIKESIPVVRNQLVDPFMYHRFYQERLRATARELGFDPDHLNEQVEAEVLLHLEERLANQQLTEEDVAELKQMSHLFVDLSCINTQVEFKMYSYPKRRHINVNVKENPRDYKNHLMDALRYWCWEKKRLRQGSAQDRYYLAEVSRLPVPELPVEHTIIPPVVQGDETSRGQMFLTTMRDLYARRFDQHRSYLAPVEHMW
jgi:hypothetical protein